MGLVVCLVSLKSLKDFCCLFCKQERFVYEVVFSRKRRKKERRWGGGD